MQQPLPELSTHQLTEIFERSMDLSTGENEKGVQPTPLAPNPEHAEPPQPSIKYSISQHYTHSAHAIQSLHPLQPSKEDTASGMLIKHGIPPSSLQRAQLILFEHANEDQRSRLIELWTIIPPTYSRNGGQDTADIRHEHESTTLAQEEELAMKGHQTIGLEEEMKEDMDLEQLDDRKPVPPVDFFLQSSSHGLQRAISQSFPTTNAYGQSFESNGRWSEDLNRLHMEDQYGRYDHFQRQNEESFKDYEDVEML